MTVPSIVNWDVIASNHYLFDLEKNIMRCVWILQVAQLQVIKQVKRVMWAIPLLPIFDGDMDDPNSLTALPFYDQPPPQRFLSHSHILSLSVSLSLTLSLSLSLSLDLPASSSTSVNFQHGDVYLFH